ncbi:MAG: hypothetical protein KJO38_09580 [Gammaproteobacteria bacterium]|nr:hypothetical protein [Gammaproteobacteria bacterium]
MPFLAVGNCIEIAPRADVAGIPQRSGILAAPPRRRIAESPRAGPGFQAVNAGLSGTKVISPRDRRNAIPGFIRELRGEIGQWT